MRSGALPAQYQHLLTGAADHDADADPDADADSDSDERIMSVMREAMRDDEQPLCRQIVEASGVQLSSDVWSAELLRAAGDDGEGGDGDGGAAAVERLTEELTEEERKLAEALVAVQFVQHSGRHPILHDLGRIAEVDHADLVDVSDLRSLSPLKRIPDGDWFREKSTAPYYAKEAKAPDGRFSNDGERCGEERFAFRTVDDIEERSDGEKCDLDVDYGIGDAKRPNGKVLPHKKRIPKKLKKHTPRILQHPFKDERRGPRDDLSEGNVDGNSLSDEHHRLEESSHSIERSIRQERALFICQLCGENYGNDQLQFFHHLKLHYELQSSSIMMEEDINDLHHDSSSLEIDKIEENMAENSQLPDSLVELSLEQSEASKSLFGQSKIAIYDTDKTLFNAEEKSSLFSSLDKSNHLYDNSLKHQSILYNHLMSKSSQYDCVHCHKDFKKQKQLDAHMKEVHKIDNIEEEFSEPEDLMEGIHVIVEGTENEEFLQSDLSSQSGPVLIQNNQEYILPHLVIENGQLHQEHVPSKGNWLMKETNDSNDRTCDDDLNADKQSINENVYEINSPIEAERNREVVSCPMCGEALRSKKDYSLHAQQCHIELKEEVIEQIVRDVDVGDTENKDKELADDTEQNAEIAKMIQKEMALTTLICPICDKQFKHKSSVTYHLLSHEGNRPHTCDVCKKSFFSPSALKVHKRLHSGAKPHQCNHCDKKFRQWGDLKYHFISLHSNQKVHKCEFCGKDFARKYSLILHRRIHTGEKNYQCEFCSKTFRASSYLQNHRKIHTGEKPHHCTLCEKKFRMKGDLRRHQVTHLKGVKLKDENQESDDKSSMDASKATPTAEEESSGKQAKDLNQELYVRLKSENSVDTNEDANSEEQNNTVSSLNMDSGEESKQSSNYQIENSSSICVWPVFIT